MEQLFDTKIPDSNYLATWNFLEPRLQFVLQNTEKGLSYAHYMSIYTAIYNYCLKTSRESGGDHEAEAEIQDPLYKRLQLFLKDHVDSLKYTETDTLNEGLLIHYKNNWDKFTMAAKTIHNMFGYMNKQISRKSSGLTSFDVYTLALNCWKENIFSHSSIYLTKTMLQMIEKQRNGEIIDHNLIKITLDSYVTLGFEVSTKIDATLNIYKDHFQTEFLAQTEQYYSHHAKSFLSDHTIPEYVSHALKCIKEENDRLTSYLHHSSTIPLIEVCHDQLIKNYAIIIQEEFQTLLDNERRSDMSKVITLLNMVPDGTNPLKTKFEQHVKTYGLQSVEQLVNNTEDSVDSKDYIDCLLLTQKKFSQLVNEAFNNDPGFIASLDKACSELVNRNKLTQKEGVTKSSELLARYCDAALRKGSKLTEETDLEQLLKDAMTIFRYVEDQDVFQKFYSRMLAKRLVNGTSSSEDGEINMISKLKDSCGQEYTYKLQKMFTDVGSSKDLNETFFNQLSNQGIKDSDIDFYTMVISFASWPLSSTATKFTLPPGLTTYHERFQRFYMHQYNGRKLNWLYHLCKGEIKAQYAHSKIPYTFIVSTYQMAILILFNDLDTISYESLCERTQLEEEVINGQLGILVKAKILLLNQGAKVGDKDSVLKFNPDFKSKKIRVNLNLPVKSEVKQETEETHQSINEDRKLYIQAAIVRVMKMRKTLLYVKLVQEVLSQISSHFKPQVVDIKKGIDILIEKEYIERDTEDKHTLKYLA